MKNVSFIAGVLAILSHPIHAIENPGTSRINAATVISFPAVAIKAPSRDVILAEHTRKVDKQRNMESGLRFIQGQGAVQQNMTNTTTTQNFYWRQ